MEAISFQDRMPGNHCFGCGPAVEGGLRIKSFWAAEGEAVCRYRPLPHLAAGPRDVLNGGIIATVIDCHSVCTAVADIYRREGREVGEGELIWCVTGTLQVEYRRPTSIDEDVLLSARVTEVAGRKSWVECDLRSGTELCAQGRVLAVRVDAAALQHGAGGRFGRG